MGVRSLSQLSTQLSPLARTQGREDLRKAPTARAPTKRPIPDTKLSHPFINIANPNPYTWQGALPSPHQHCAARGLVAACGASRLRRESRSFGNTPSQVSVFHGWWVGSCSTSYSAVSGRRRRRRLSPLPSPPPLPQPQPQPQLQP